MSQAITLLRTHGRLLAKRWRADGTIADNDLAKRFEVQRHPIGDIRELHELLKEMQDDPHACIIRGEPVNAPTVPGGTIERNLDNFTDAPSRLFMIDVDGFAMAEGEEAHAAIVRFVATLPSCFQRVAYVWQLSGSFGHCTKRGLLRTHLWYWLAEPLTCEQAEAWTRAHLHGVDKTVHRTVQINYTARPVIETGHDPVPTRLGLVQLVDGNDELRLNLAAYPLPAPEAHRLARAARHSMVDPRLKRGIVGAFCRTYAPTDLVTLCPEHFVRGSRPTRITWLNGGGSKDGVYVTDDGMHLGSSHDSAPHSRALNIFDFIRLHVFGHEDDGIEPEVLEFSPSAAPSFQSMVKWAKSLPAVQAQLHIFPTAAPEGEFQPSVEGALKRAQMYVRRIEEADEHALRGPITADIVKDKSLQDLERHGVVAAAYQQALHRLTGLKPCMGDVKRALALNRHAAAGPPVEQPDWLKPWVWCQEGDVFVDMQTKVGITKLSFDATYNRNMPVEGKGMRPSASAHVLANCGVPVVAGKMYQPRQGLLFEYGGVQYLNLYSDADQPALCATPLTER